MKGNVHRSTEKILEQSKPGSMVCVDIVKLDGMNYANCAFPKLGLAVAISPLRRNLRRIIVTGSDNSI